MKLLFDQNISFRIIKKLSGLYPNAKQIKDLGLENATDLKIWTFAKSNNFTIVTFDSDFVDLINLKGFPPKIIWLRIGNTTTDSIAKVFTEKYDLIKDFLQNPEYKDIACLEIE